MAYDSGNNLRVLYKSEATTASYGPRESMPNGGEGHLQDAVYTTDTAYDRLGLNFTSTQAKDEQAGDNYIGEETTINKKDLIPLGFEIMADGTEIIPYQIYEQSGRKRRFEYFDTRGYDNSANYTTVIKGYIYFNGGHVPVSENTYDSTVIDHFNFPIYAYGPLDVLINLNAKRDKAVIKFGQRVFLIENGKLQDITDDHPDFKTASFFTFLGGEDEAKILSRATDDLPSVEICEQADLAVKVTDGGGSPQRKNRDTSQYSHNTGDSPGSTTLRVRKQGQSPEAESHREKQRDTSPIFYFLLDTM